jgi:hypothetical protein
VASAQFTRRLLSGLLTFLPGGRQLSERHTGGTDSARYCYWVWLHHLILARRNGLEGPIPVVAELGPGESLGTGLAALLSGADRYHAFDIVPYADSAMNLRVLDELVELFARRVPVTDETFSSPIFQLDEFPARELPESHLERALAEDRIEAIRGALRNLGQDSGNVLVTYEPDWLKARAAPEEQPQLLISQAVLEHVDDLAGAYDAMFRWLAPGGFISHEIDFRSHDFARTWNGHWTFSDRSWALIRGRRRYGINREPLSTHLRLASEAGFRIVHVKRLTRPSTLTRGELATRFRSLSDEDRTTSTALIQAVKDTAGS